MNNKVVVIGSSNTDMIIKVPRIPKPGETILGGTFSTAAGGKGANQAVAAARAGADVTFIACIGKDPFGDEALKGFEADGINTEHIIQHPTAPSGIAQILVSEDGENSIAVAPGANSELTPDHIHNAKDVIESAALLLLQLEIPLNVVIAAVEIASQKKIPVILNPAPAQALDDSLLSKLSIITPNETETEILTGISISNETDIQKAANSLLNKGIETVIITLGEKGAYVATKEEHYSVPGFTVKAIDTTAAGDVFNGALTTALCQNNEMESAVKYANAAAALSVTKLGAQPSAPNLEEIQNLLLMNQK